MDLRIRPAAADDASTLATLAAQLGYPLPTAALVATLGELLHRAEHAVLVATLDGQVVGWLHAREEWSLESGRRAEIAGLVVDEAARGQGAGARLVAAAEAWARGRGLERIRVRSRVERAAAHRFYRRLGYAESKVQAVLDRLLDAEG